MGRAAYEDRRGRGVELSVSKVIYSFSVSLDGFMESRDRKLDWVLVDEELHRFFNDEAREVGTFVYGRRLYELMVDFWPTADSDPSLPGYMADFARIWREKPKVVFSKTLKKVEWNSRLATDGLAEEIARMKADPGGDIAIGGANLAAAAIELDLVDEGSDQGDAQAPLELQAVGIGDRWVIGEGRGVEALAAILAAGNGADRRRAAAARGGVDAMLAEIADATLTTYVATGFPTSHYWEDRS